MTQLTAHTLKVPVPTRSQRKRPRQAGIPDYHYSPLSEGGAVVRFGVERRAMNEKILALLLHDQDEPLSSLKSALTNLSVETTRARTCAEAFNELQRRVKPHLVFTDVTLPDGTWADVLRLPRKAFALVDVIVVARVVDMRLYIAALEGGASDFLVPPFIECDLAYVVRRAAWDVLARRGGWRIGAGACAA